MDNALMARARANVYGFLANHYKVSPDKRFHQWVTSPAYLEFLKGISELYLNGAFDKEVKSVAKWLEDATSEAGTNDESVNTLLSDWTMLMRGVHPARSPPPPYESVYKGGGLNSEVTAAVKSIYRKNKLVQSAAESDELPDHIGVELEFLEKLCRREEECLSRGGKKSASSLRKTEYGFLRDHLDWVEKFAQELCKRSISGFYASIVSITAGWLSSERAALAPASDRGRGK